MSKMHIDKNTPAEDMTPGGEIYQSGNAREFKTGDWRSMCPVWISEKCTQCGLCFPVCPDDSIPVNSEGKKRRLLTMIIVKVAVFVVKYVLLEPSK